MNEPTVEKNSAHISSLSLSRGIWLLARRGHHGADVNVRAIVRRAVTHLESQLKIDRLTVDVDVIDHWVRVL